MKRIAGEGVVLFIGMIFYVLSTLLITPVEIVPGSVLGVAVVTHAIFDIPIGLMTTVCNIPIMILCTKCFGKKILIYTIIIIAGTSILIDLFLPVFPPVFEQHGFLLAVLGGGMMGIGAGLLMRVGGTMGGTTAISRLLQKKYPKTDMGRALFVMDTSIILMGTILLKSFSGLMYSVIYTFVCCKAISWICSFKTTPKKCLTIKDSFN